MLLTADRIVYEGYAYPGVGIKINDAGRIVHVGPLSELGKPDVHLRDKVLLPGLVNAHSHAFQRLLRGRTQFAGPGDDNFWSWRESMYWVAGRLDPHSLYIASRQAFLEMLLAGVTTVGEFHYLHQQPDGEPYPNPHELSDAVIQAAREVGIRCSLIYTVYLRGDFDKSPDQYQKRFCAKSLDSACDLFDDHVQRLIDLGDYRMSWAIAAHSVRAMPLDAIIGLKVRLAHMPFHLHVSEQRREVDACVAKHGMGPVELLARCEVIDASTTLVHATHLRPGEAEAIAELGAGVCVCPSTEADLADGLGPVGQFFHLGVPMCLGSDGQTMTSIMAEAARLEMHERLHLEHRNVLARQPGDAVATHLLKMATTNGAVALGLETGQLRPGQWADLVTYDLNDPALAGCDDASLLSSLLFSSDSRAVRDVFVAGQQVVEDGKHPLMGESNRAFNKLSNEIFTPPTT